MNLIQGYKSKVFIILLGISAFIYSLGWIDATTFATLTAIFIPGLGYGLVDKIGR